MYTVYTLTHTPQYVHKPITNVSVSASLLLLITHKRNYMQKENRLRTFKKNALIWITVMHIFIPYSHFHNAKRNYNLFLL